MKEILEILNVDNQKRLTNSLNLFLRDLKEDSDDDEYAIIGVICLKHGDDIYYIKDNQLEKVSYSEMERIVLSKPSAHKKFKRKEDIIAMSMMLNISDDSVDIAQYIKISFGFEYVTQTDIFLKENGSSSVCIVFGYNKLNSFLGVLLSEFGETWLNDGLLYNGLSRLSDSEEIVAKALSRWNLNYIDIGCVNAISTLNYESEKCTGKIMFAKAEAIELVLPFAHRINFSTAEAKTIRKLLQISNNSLSLMVSYDSDIIWSRKDEIIGFGKVDFSQTTVDFYVEVSGYLTWTLYEKNNTTPILQHSAGRYILPRVNKENLWSNIKKKVYNICGNETIWDVIIDKAMAQIHGTTIIITDNAQQEAGRFGFAKRGYLVQNTEKKPTSLLAHLDIIEDITNIDGAVLLDYEGNCYAIGVILDGAACIVGESSRGARYNSTQNYIALKQKQEENHTYIAIVVSEDRYVNIFTTNDEFKFIN